MKLNIEDYNYIAEQEKEFAHALNESYFRVINRNMLMEYSKIYKRVFNRDSKILNGCMRCVLNDIKALATVYFNDKKEMEEKAVENKPIDNVTDNTIDNVIDNSTEPNKMSIHKPAAAKNNKNKKTKK